MKLSMGTEPKKNILIISPQPWGKAFLSKHHYAIELSKIGHRVYFLCPPQILKGQKFQSREIQENLFVVEHQLNFPYILKFHARWLFDIFVKKHVKQLLTYLNRKLDIVWCFDPNIYADLSCFEAQVKIYHPVDPIDYPEQVKVAHTADIILSVSEKILSSFGEIPKPKYFINHGLGKPFEALGEKLLKENKPQEKKEAVRLGYIGNLLRPIIGRDTFRRLIKELPQAEFHFWGFYELKESNLSGEADKETKEFIEFLNESQNVRLHGSRSPEELANEIVEMDAFLLYYMPMKGMSDLSNSHKILEYLSTGKTILSCQISTYKNLTGLMEMQGEEEDYVAFVSQNLSRLTYLNAAFSEKRIRYAIMNTYQKQVEKIFSILKAEEKVIEAKA